MVEVEQMKLTTKMILVGAFLFPIIVYLFFLFELLSLPTGRGLEKSDWLSFIGSYSSAFVALGAIIFGVMQYRAGIDYRDEQRRKEKTYRPLYDELMGMQNSILVKTPFPVIIDFERQRHSSYPCYDIWRAIELDNRRFDIPADLGVRLDKLRLKIGEYLAIRESDNAKAEIKKILDETLAENAQPSCNFMGIEAHLLNLVLPDNDADICDSGIIRGSDNTDKNVKEKINATIYRKCNEVQSIRNIRKKYQEYLDAQESAIDLLGKLIKSTRGRF